MSDSNASRIMEALLLEVMNEAEIRAFFGRIGLGRDLPGAGTSFSYLCYQAADLLRRRGRIEAELFAALADLGRFEEVAAAAKSCGVAVPVRRVAAAPVAVAPAPLSSEPLDPKVLDLKSLIVKRQVVVILGAGVSVATSGGAPTASWKGFLRDGVTRCQDWAGADPAWCLLQRDNLEMGETEDWIGVARRITQKLGGRTGGEFRRWLRESIGQLPCVDPSLIKAIAALECPVATTNYDDLFERVTGWRSICWDAEAEVTRLLRERESGVLHLHGFWSRPESVVLGVESYQRVADAPHARAVREALRTTHSLLFIGCGDTTADPNIGEWLRWSGEVFAGDEYRNYRLELDGCVAEVQGRHPAAQRLFVIGYGASYDDLPAFLRRLRA